MSSVLKSFGNKVRQERLKRKLSREKFAELVGLHRTYIGMVERGEKNITLKNTEKITKAFEISLDELMNLEK